MPKLENIQDRETLQQAALLLEKTVIRLYKENAKLRAENARLRGDDVDPQMEIELLRKQLAAMQHKVFGASSEKRPHTEDNSSGEKEKPRRGHGPRSQPDLPIKIVDHTLDEEDRTCSICGHVLVEMGGQAEESEEITVIGLEYKIVKHRRQKYRCKCNEHVLTAPGPVKLIPGGRYSIDFAVQVAEGKYLDHLPLERQVRAMERAGPNLQLAHCWAHVRRKFLEAEDAYPELSRHAVKRIGDLFKIERETPKVAFGASDDEREATLELRRRLREERSKPIADGLLQWALEKRPAVLPKSKMGTAIAYMLKLWKGLTRFLNDPQIPLDNNAAERALRGVVVGRKNHYGSRSKRGTEVAALFYTIFETAKLSQVDPRAYVTKAATRAIQTPGAVTLPSDLM